jgi:hypothetical protein
MKNYKIRYYFDGSGEVVVKAKDEEEARDMFFEGQWENEKEWGEDYQIEEITKK